MLLVSSGTSRQKWMPNDPTMGNSYLVVLRNLL